MFGIGIIEVRREMGAHGGTAETPVGVSFGAARGATVRCVSSGAARGAIVRGSAAALPGLGTSPAATTTWAFASFSSRMFLSHQ